MKMKIKMKNRIVSLVFLLCFVSSVIWVSDVVGETNSPTSPYLDGVASIVIDFTPSPIDPRDIVKVDITVYVSDQDVMLWSTKATYSVGEYHNDNDQIRSTSTGDTRQYVFYIGSWLVNPGDQITVNVEVKLVYSAEDQRYEHASKSTGVTNPNPDPINDPDDDGINPGTYIYDGVNAVRNSSIITGVNSFIMVFLLTAILALVIFYVRRNK